LARFSEKDSGAIGRQVFIGDIWPDDTRDRNQKISGIYALVAPKYHWPNGTVVWDFDPLLWNISKFFSCVWIDCQITPVFFYSLSELT